MYNSRIVTKIMDRDCVILIPSCDAFADAWEPFFTLLFRYWPDCPFQIYLVSEKKTYPDPRVTTLLFKDEKWATNTLKALDRITAPTIIYLQEDYLLMKKVDTERILRLIEILKNDSIGCIRLWTHKPYKEKWFVDSSLRVIDKCEPYAISLQATLWKKEVFKKLIIAGESGWDMEFKGSQRSIQIPEIFLSVQKNEPALDYFATGIQKGMWVRPAVNLIKREGIDFKSTRRVESWWSSVTRGPARLPVVGGIFRRIRRYGQVVERKFK